MARRRLRDTAAAKTHGAQGGVPRASSLRFRPLPRRPTGPKEGNSVAAATWERGLEAQCAAAERAMSPEMKMTTLTKKPMRINTDVRRSPRIRIRSPPEAVRYNAMLRHMFALRNPASPPAATLGLSVGSAQRHTHTHTFSRKSRFAGKRPIVRGRHQAAVVGGQ